MREQLFISGIEIPLSKSLNPSFTKSIIDIREPDKRSSTYSKTVAVPRSKEADDVFGFIFEINISSGSFNPNLKADALYLVDGVEQIRGYCQLKDLVKTNNYDIEYSIVLFSEFANLFKGIQNKWLDEIEGLETYDHILNKEIQNWSVNQDGVYEIIENGVLVPAQLGKGYIYPLVDYGFSTDINTFKSNHIGCAIFVQEYWDRVFKDAGFTYEFTDLDFADHFKHLIIPSSPETYLLDATEINNRQFEANTPLLTSTNTTTSNNITKDAWSADDTIKFTNEIIDPGGVYNPLTGVFTCTQKGFYDFATIIDITAFFIPSSGGTVNSVGYVDFKAKVIFYDNSALTTTVIEEDGFRIYHDGFAIGTRQSNTPSTYPDSDYKKVYPFPLGLINRFESTPNQLFLSLSNLNLNTSDTIKIVWSANYKTDYPSYFVNGGGTYSNGNARINISVGAFLNKATNTAMVEGNLLKVNKCIPKVKQTDFLLNYIKEYNLYFEIDPSKTDHFLIAPRDNFYTNNIVDLTGLISIDKGITYEPIGALDAKEYLFKHKDDEDYLNVRYRNSWQETYGQREVTTINEFNEKTNKTEVSSSPTPMADNGTGNNRVIPTIVQVDELGQKISTKHNWRTLYYGGQKTNQTAWLHESEIFPSEYFTTYPFAGHWDDPFNPTLDINFGLVREVYYYDLIDPIVVTDNNLYNKYHSKFIREITDKDSKIVRAFVNMDAFYFNQWRFSDLYYFDNAYFRLNKIDGFNPTNNDLTKVEFMKLKEVSPFKPTLTEAQGDGVSFEPNTEDGLGGGGGVLQVEYMPLKGITQGIKKDTNNYNSQSGTVSGTGNLISKTSYYVSIMGSNNTVLGSCQNINLINSNNNVIESGLFNVSLINSNNLTVKQSNVNYVNGVQVQESTTSVVTVTANRDISPTVTTYRGDTTAGSVTLTFNLTGIIYTKGQIWNFKKETALNSFIISGGGTATIDGAANRTLTAIDSVLNIQYVGGTEFIII